MIRNTLVSLVLLWAAGLVHAADPIDSKGLKDGWRLYKNDAFHFSFSYPNRLILKEGKDENGLFTLTLSGAKDGTPSNDPSTISLKVIPFSKVTAKTMAWPPGGIIRIGLPKRFSYPVYYPKTNMWYGQKDGAEEYGNYVPMCLDTTELGNGRTVYAHTDAMHGWTATVFLGSGGRGYEWSGPESGVTEDIAMKEEIIRTLVFLDDQKTIKADCPTR